MKTIIRSIAAIVFFVGCLHAAGDSFPWSANKSVSPDKRYELSCKIIKAPPGEDEYAPWYQLVFGETKGGTKRTVKDFVGTAEVLWAPDSQHYAVTYWWGSDIAFVRIYSSTARITEIDPYEIIKRVLGKLPQVENENHVYSEVIKWLDSNRFLLKISGHWDRPPAVPFEYHFVVWLAGDARLAKPNETVKKPRG